MNAVEYIFFVGLICGIIGMIGGIVLIKLVDRGTYGFEHPPDLKIEEGEEGDSDG